MKYLILGCGGHAKVLIGTISMMKDASVHGLLTSNSNELGLSILGCDVLGMDEDINKFSASEFSLVNGVGDLKIRQHLFEKYQGKNGHGVDEKTAFIIQLEIVAQDSDGLGYP